MVDLTKVERLAELKSIMKSLDAEAKLLQDEIIADGAPDKIKTLHGTLSLTTRETWECTDKEKLYYDLGPAGFISVSTVSVSNITKQFGKVKVNKLKLAEMLALKSVSQYYTLRK